MEPRIIGGIKEFCERNNLECLRYLTKVGARQGRIGSGSTGKHELKRSSLKKRRYVIWTQENERDGLPTNTR